jgi:hypothetical protein
MLLDTLPTKWSPDKNTSIKWQWPTPKAIDASKPRKAEKP